MSSHVSKPMVHLQEDGCIYSYGMFLYHAITAYVGQVA